MQFLTPPGELVSADRGEGLPRSESEHVNVSPVREGLRNEGEAESGRLHSLQAPSQLLDHRHMSSLDT